MSLNSNDAKIKEVEDLAKEVLKLKNKSIPRRPIVIEFCGSPKSGKTSCINSLDLFLRRNKFRTQLITERASVCPVKDKFDPLFNVWTATSTLTKLSEIMANNAKDFDVIIMDRGIFDAICWFNWLLENECLDDSNHKSLINFLTMDKWRKAIDLVYVFTASPEVSLDREYANLLTRKHGTIMHPQVLKTYKETVENTVKEYGKIFREVTLYDTSETGLNEVNYSVTRQILDILLRATAEKIGYLNPGDLSEISDDHFRYSDVFGNEEIQIQFDIRNRVEKANDKVQPIPIVVITNAKKDSVLVAKKNKTQTSKHSPESNSLLLYFGGHIREEDMVSSSRKDLLGVAKDALMREIKEELGIDYFPSDNDPLCIWLKNNDRSVKHLAMCFVFEKDLEFVKFKLDSNEFITHSTSKSGRVLKISEIETQFDDLEGWSKIIIQEIFERQRPEQMGLEY